MTSTYYVTITVYLIRTTTPLGGLSHCPLHRWENWASNKLFALNYIASEMVGQDLKPGLKSKSTCFHCTMLPPRITGKKDGGPLSGSEE